MCGRTSLFVAISELEERFDATATNDFPPRYNIAPSDDLAVVTNEADDEIQPVRWGLVPSWADDPKIGARMINARAETVDEKNSFKYAYEKRRCLVLADGFYEWQKPNGGPKQPYRIYLEDDEPFAFAGLWERWTPDDGNRKGNDSNGGSENDSDGGDGSAELTTCTIITTEPNDVVEPIHDRMPVVLAPDEEDDWLHEPSKALLDPYAGDDMRAYPISKRVNDPRNDSPDIIAEIDDPGRQSGIGEFG